MAKIHLFVHITEYTKILTTMYIHAKELP